MAFQEPYLPPPLQEFLVPSPGLSSPPGLQPLPFQYPQMCPGLPRHVLQEHQQVLEEVAHQQGQLHRVHLELGAAHERITENAELMAQLEVRLRDLEFRVRKSQEA